MQAKGVKWLIGVRSEAGSQKLRKQRRRLKAELQRGALPHRSLVEALGRFWERAVVASCRSDQASVTGVWQDSAWQEPMTRARKSFLERGNGGAGNASQQVP